MKDTTIVMLAEAAGGVMRHVIDLSKGLLSRGWNVQLILSPLRLEMRYQDEIRATIQSNVTYLPLRRSPHPSDLKALLDIKHKLSCIGGRVLLHAHSTKAGLLGSALHQNIAKKVFTPHAYRGMDPTLPPVSRFFLHEIEKWYSEGYDRVIAVAPTELTYAEELGLPRKILTCIPNGLDISGKSFDTMRSKRLSLDSPPCLGFVGRLVYQKNPVLFVETLAEVIRRGCNARAIVVGDGDLKSEMLATAKRLGVLDRIDWRGGIPAESSLHEMDFMVHTSRYEGLPYTIIEACGALLPVVATVNQGSVSILGTRLPENLVYSPQAPALADVIMSLVDDNTKRASQLDALQAIADEFSADRMITNIEAEYGRLLSST